MLQCEAREERHIKRDAPAYGLIPQPNWLIATAPRAVAACLVALMLLRSGVWLIPNIGASRLIAEDPFVNPFSDPAAHALFWSWLGPFLAWLLGARGPAAFFTLHFGFAAAFIAATLTLLSRRLTGRQFRTATLLFVVLPVSATSFFWVGNDGLTLLLMVLAFLAGHPLGGMLAGVALGMQHFEQGFLGFAALVAGLLLARWLHHPVAMSITWAAFVLAGVVLGKLTLIALFATLGIEVNSGRLWWLRENLPMLLEQFFLHPHVVVWSVLGLGWLILASELQRGRVAWPLALPLLGLMPLLLVSGDQTRVLAIVTFPLITTFWLLEPTVLARHDDRRLTRLFVLWLVVPWIWVWGGVPRWSALPYDLAFALHHATGWPSLPEDLARWPFLAE